jgi:hypothetical protein
MAIRSSTLACLVCLAALLLVTGHVSGERGAPGVDVPGPIENTAEKLKADLEKQGYEVTRGYTRLYTEDDCVYSYASMKSCYGNNPAAPYVLPAVRNWPEEFVDPATKLAFGVLAEGYQSTFRLDPREAIVIYGRLPPKAAYFGLQTYLFTREGTWDQTSGPYTFIAQNFPYMLPTFFATVPNNPKRIQAIASLSNSNNNVVIEAQSGAAFDKKRALIITPDQFMDAAVREALDRVSVNEEKIFTEPIPSTMKLGLDEGADDFLPVIRYAEPQDGGAPGTPSDDWRKDPPLVVLRVRDPRTERPPQPFGPPVLEPRTAADESGLKTPLLKLVSEVNSRWGQPCVRTDCSDRAISFIDLQSPPINLVGPQCTQIGMDCLGDTQDTTYQGTPNLSLDRGEVYAIVGTLGTETGNATYVGLSVNDSLLLKGIDNISSNQLRGTALDYAGIADNADKFYVYYFTRDCSELQALTGGHCFSIPDTSIPVCRVPGSPACHYLKLIQREYVRQGTQRGPDSALTLQPMLSRFTRARIYLPLVYQNE